MDAKEACHIIWQQVSLVSLSSFRRYIKLADEPRFVKGPKWDELSQKMLKPWRLQNITQNYQRRISNRMEKNQYMKNRRSGNHLGRKYISDALEFKISTAMPDPIFSFTLLQKSFIILLSFPKGVLPFTTTLRHCWTLILIPHYHFQKPNLSDVRKMTKQWQKHINHRQSRPPTLRELHTTPT